MEGIQIFMVINLKILIIVILFIIYNGNDVKRNLYLTDKASFVQVDNFKNLIAS